MKVECGQEKLRKAIDYTERVTGKSLPLVVLGSILLEATDKELIVRSTNLDLGIEVKVSAKVSKKGKVALSGAHLRGFLHGVSKDGNVVLESVEGNLAVSAGSNNVLIKAQKHEEFPNIPKVSLSDKETWGVKIDSHVITEGVGLVSYAGAITEIKPEIASVYIYPDGDHLVFVATDTFRLAEKKVSAAGTDLSALKDAPPILVPLKNINEIARILDDSPEEIELLVTTDQLAIRAADKYLTTRLVEGKFPDYKAIVPSKFTTQAVVEKDALTTSLKLSNVFAGKQNQVILKIDPGEKIFELSSRSSDVGESSSSLEGTLEGDPVDITLNAKYLLDVMSSISRDSLTLGLNGAHKAVLVRGVGDRSFTYLLMPLNK